MVGDKKRSRNSSDQIMTQKQPKADDCWQEIPIPTYNTFKELEEMPEDVNNNTEPVRGKPFPIFISKVSDTPFLRQLLNQITNGEFYIKISNIISTMTNYNLKAPSHILI